MAGSPMGGEKNGGIRAPIVIGHDMQYNVVATRARSPGQRRVTKGEGGLSWNRNHRVVSSSRPALPGRAVCWRLGRSCLTRRCWAPRPSPCRPATAFASARSASACRAPACCPTPSVCPASNASARADLYDGRHTLAKEITNNPSLPTTRRYQELLDRKDIDCIIAAVPDHWHKRSRRRRLQCRQRYLLREAHVAHGRTGLRRWWRPRSEQSHRANRFAARQLRALRQGPGHVSRGRHWRHRNGRAQPGPQRSQRRLGVSAAHRRLRANRRLGHLAQRRPQDSVR